MNKKIIRYLIILLACLAVLYPLWQVGSTIDWRLGSSSLVSLFPLFGLAAFSILWLHAISGVFEKWLRQYIDFDFYVQVTSTLVLLSIILHPLLLLIVLKFNFIDLLHSAQPLYIALAISGWLLLISYDITKPLKKKFKFFSRNWSKILLISNIGFLLTFFHSIGAGDNLQSGPLRTLWIFYGVTAILAIIYTYGIDRSWQKQANSS